MRYTTVAAVLAVAGFAGSAMANNPILSFGFTDLSASFDQASMSYVAMGVDTTNLKTAGQVNRHITPVATALYNPGTAANRVEVSLAISNVAGTTADGVGSVWIEDVDGNRFTADVAGTFSLQAPAVFFNGILDNIAWVPGAGPNNTHFTGPSGGSFPLTFAPATGPLTGALMQLNFESAGSLFGQSFQGRTTQINGAVIPAPATLALLGFGGLAAARRRRRN